MNKTSYLALSLAAFISNLSFAAANFNITVAPGTSLPSSIGKGETASAFFKITNNTHSTRSGYTVQGLPNTVNQYSDNKNYCSKPIKLAALQSCILRLDIQGPVDSRFALCHGASCTTSAVPLKVKLATATVPLVAAGFAQYSGHSFYPLLAQSQDQGKNWSYIKSVQNQENTILFGSSCTQNLCIAVGTDFINGPVIVLTNDAGKTWSLVSNISLPLDYESKAYFVYPSCSDSLCVAVGGYKSTATSAGVSEKPLISVSQDKGKTWNSPPSSYSKLPKGLTSGLLHKISCDANLCITSGEYTKEFNALPLLAFSRDGGGNWSYPELASILPSNLVSIEQFHAGATCSGSICIASYSYYTEEHNDKSKRPLLLITKDRGAHWSAPTSIQQLPTGAISAGFSSPSCSGTVCIAVGAFDTEQEELPLLGLSQDGGTTWSYSKQIYQQLPAQGTNGSFISASCDGSLCIAAGSFVMNNLTKPLLAVSTDSGKTWRYPPEIYTKLPSDFVDKGGFNYGANCQGLICTAVGQYRYNDGDYKPLLVLSTDGGQTWSYPSQIDAAANLPVNFASGVFNPDPDGF